jgi:mercuric ion binding protein
MKKILTIAVMLLMVVSVQAQKKKKNAKVTVEVDGVCMMCKKRIEKAALNTKGVKFANWDVASHQLTLIMDERKTDKQTVCNNIAKVGHDSELAKAPQEVYDNIHGCCKYRDEEIQDDHKKKDE